MTDDVNVKLLRLHVGTEGQRLFDALNLKNKTLDDALGALDKYFDFRMNTYVARYKFSQLHQASGESAEDFITRITCAVRPCAYNTIPSKKLEEVLQIQQLIAGTSESRVREALLVEDASTLTWTRACDIVKAKIAFAASWVILLRSVVQALFPRLMTHRIIQRMSFPAMTAYARLVHIRLYIFLPLPSLDFLLQIFTQCILLCRIESFLCSWNLILPHPTLLSLMLSTRNTSNIYHFNSHHTDLAVILVIPFPSQDSFSFVSF
ncbi:hypothetical protein D915_005763 [Fasciola hepatica]|uniref:Uncharacterized protein n=1 Tax=Fasciola hepatica TaxID=6192 RepID=A0A4E0R4S0_FASHE|nr:hypothetical protein D915_005763 [Fasciola hepatica]